MSVIDRLATSAEGVNVDGASHFTAASLRRACYTYLCHELLARSMDYLLPLPYSLVTGRETDLASSPNQGYYSVLPQHFASRRSTALRFVHTAHSNTCSPSLAVYVIFNHTSHAVSCLFEASANRFESKAPKRDRQVPPCQRKKGLQWM